MESRAVAPGPISGNPDLPAFSLWRTAQAENSLGAFPMPTPVDGTGLRFTQDIDPG